MKDIKEYEVLSCDEQEIDTIKIKKYKVKHKLFNNKSIVVNSNIMNLQNGVGILLYDRQKDKVVLIEQFRFGPINEALNPWLIEIIAGINDADESVDEIAIREVFEETGITVQKVFPMISYLVNPSTTNQKIDLFYAFIDSTQLDENKTHGLISEGEDIKMHIMDLDTACKYIESGKINNSLTIIALLWLKLNKSLICQS